MSSPSAAARLRAAGEFLLRFSPSTERLLVAATRGAADDLARECARGGAIFGFDRASLTELAARTVAAAASGARRIAGTQASAEAMAARAAFDAASAGELTYFAPVAQTPGFPRAVARTAHELRLAGVGADTLAAHGPAGGDLSCLLARIEHQTVTASIDDRAALFDAAARTWAAVPLGSAAPVVLLDVALESAAERRLAEAVCRAASDALVTFPQGDDGPTRLAATLRQAIDEVQELDEAASDLLSLRRHLFSPEAPPARDRRGDVRLFSAPGEGRETIEIARRILDEAVRGVRFDEMAIVVRSPRDYLGLLEHAFDRAGIPAYFDRGIRRPDPSGRAFLALIACACERLSARRFDEYLSLGQVPQNGSAPAEHVIRPLDESLLPQAEDEAPAHEQPPADDTDDQAIIGGALRAPWKWEELIVEASVVGGTTANDGRERWRRRLAGLAHEYRLKIDALVRQEPESARIARFQRDLRNLEHLQAFALPVIDTLAEWSDAVSWAEWLDRLAAFAPLVLGRPDRVLRAIADLRPMGEIGPVRLDEVRDVLQDRLLALDWDPPASRYGRVFVGSPHQIRGRAFRMVFVPGLAERIFPQRMHEDPMLLDDLRRPLSPQLATQSERTAAERLLLRLSIGAATERLYFSYPRLDVGETRPRVPSFYALDIMRAITGRVPDHRALATDAGAESGAALAWPAPADPDTAIDDLEHDLAVLRPLLDSHDAAAVKGRAHYLLELNDALRRSVTGRWLRGRRTWSANDGLIRRTPAIAPLLDSQRLGARPYSVSALQRFAACPYQFLLASMYRLEPWEAPEPIVHLDPLTRGSLFHQVQAEFLRTLQHERRLPVTRASLPAALATLRAVLDRVGGEQAEQLVPAIDRVWRDELDELGRDLGIWVQWMADHPDWIPEYFEYSFGLSDAGRDPRSRPDPVTIGGRFMLRGSVDLIERNRQTRELRVTDHKTGKDRTMAGLVIHGGSVLQPVLYSMAVAAALAENVASGRLFFCTSAGGFSERIVPMGPRAVADGLEALTIVDRAIERGVLPAAPHEGACARCDFRPVCGPREEERIRRKNPRLLEDLAALREKP